MPFIPSSPVSYTRKRLSKKPPHQFYFFVYRVCVIFCVSHRPFLIFHPCTGISLSSHLLFLSLCARCPAWSLPPGFYSSRFCVWERWDRYRFILFRRRCRTSVFSPASSCGFSHCGTISAPGQWSTAPNCSPSHSSMIWIARECRPSTDRWIASVF